MAITSVKTRQQLTVNSDVTFGSLYKITNLVDPTNPQDGATKAYVDAVKTGLDIKDSVRVASTAAITVTYNATGGTSTRGQITAAPNSIDGVTLAAGNRILLKDQAAGAQNGIWVVSTLGTGANGVWDRAIDFDGDLEVTGGAFTFVEEGTANADSGWVLTNNNPITIGGSSGTALTWTQFSGAGQITAGAGLTKTGNTIDAVGTANRIIVNADSIDIGTDVVTLTGAQTLTNKSIVATQLTGTLQAAQFPALTGDVTTTAGALGTTIAANAVTLGKLATLAANSVIGNATGSTATPTAVSMLTTATASAVAIRDTNANIKFNNSVNNLTTTATAAATTTLTVASSYMQQFTGTTTQTVVLPDATTLTVGHSFLITNRSTGIVTVNANGGGLVQTMAASSQVIVTVVTTGTAAGTWDAAYSITNAGSGGGSVTSVSVVSVNGFAGTVDTATSTPAIRISTTVSGLLKGNGTGVSAATAGTDYQGVISLTTNNSSGSASFNGTTLNIPTYTLAGLGGFANPMTTLGDMIYGGASGAPTRLANAGTTNGVYIMQQTVSGAAAAAPSWLGTTGSGNVVLATSPTITGGSHTALTTLGVRDTSAAFDVTIAATSSTALTAGRTLTIDMVNAARTLKFAGNIDIAGNLTTAGAFTTSGAFGITLTATATTSVTLPTTGTLVSTTNYVVRETPSGTVNGTNAAFTLANTPVSGTEQVYVNGVLQNGGGNDYTISGATITFTSNATPSLDARPQTGDVVLVSYLK
jgi:hypothetical protein